MNVKEFMKKYWEYILAFLVPVFIVLAHCITRNTWLFGEGSILRGDANTQYVYIFEELWNKVHSGDFSFFSWNAAGGFDFYLNVLYYAISPATLVILLLPKSCLEDALQVFMVLKWALLSFSAVYFFMHTRYNKLKKNRRLVSLTLGLCFALSTFCIYAVSFFNWMDTMILFPLLLLLVEKLVEKGVWKKYYVVLTIAICCNYYIAFPICIFLLLWFVLQLQRKSHVNKKAYSSFFGASVLAGFSSLAIILPSVWNAGSRAFLPEENRVGAYVKSIVELPHTLISKFFALGMSDDFAMSGFSFYMSMGMLAVCLMFFFVKMQKKTKITKLLITALLLLSICFGGLNYVWHGFSIPYGYSNRFGFIFIMMLLILALDVIVHLKDLKVRHCFIMLGVSVVLFCYAFFNIEVFDEVYVYLCTFLLAAFYFIMLVLMSKKSIKKNSFILVVCCLCIVELCANAYYQFSQYEVQEAHEDEHAKESVLLLDGIELADGERVVFPQAAANTGIRAGVPSVSGFVAYANGRMGSMISKLGMNAKQETGISYTGSTPLLNTLFHIGNGVGAYDVECSDSSVLVEDDELNVYKTNQLTGLGYMVEESVTEWTLENNAPFDAQNMFVQCATNITQGELFTTYKPSDLACSAAVFLGEETDETADKTTFAYRYMPLSSEDGCVLTFTADKDSTLYVNLRSSVEATMAVRVDNQEIYRSSALCEQITLPIGSVQKGQEISVVCVVENQAGKEITVSGQVAEFHEDVWKTAQETLSQNVYQISEMKSDYICGGINAEEKGIMMTSVPAMDGFAVYVDGEQTSYEVIGGALIGIPLEKGEHKVEFRYQTPYAKAGWLLSLCGIVVFMTICVIRRKTDASLFCETGTTE